MSGLPSDHVRSRSKLWECCELMDWTANRFKPYITQSLCPNCCMRRPPGMDSPARKTVIGSIHSWRNHQNSHSLLPDQTSFGLAVWKTWWQNIRKSQFRWASCAAFACCRLWMSPATIFVVELIHSSYQQNAKLSYRTKTFQNEFSIKIHISNGIIVFVNNVLIEFRRTL